MKLTDVFKKYKTNPKAWVGILGFLFVTGSLLGVRTCVNNTTLRNELTTTRQSLESIVRKEQVRLDSMILVYRDSINVRDVVIETKNKKIKQQAISIKTLQKNLDTALEEASVLPADSSYNYINKRIIPTGPLNYPFDSLQVKKIHYTFLERDGFKSLNDTLNYVVFDLRQVSSLKDNQIVNLNALVNVYSQKNGIYGLENSALKNESIGLKKDVKKQKFLRNILAPPAAVGLGTVTYFIIKAFTK